MAEAPVTTTKAPTPTAPNVPGSIPNPINPTFAADPVLIDQMSKWNWQNENFLAGDRNTLENYASTYNRTLLGLEGTENKGYKALGGRDLRRFAGNYGEGLGDRQELAREYTQRRGALAERLGQNYQKIARGIQEREGRTGIATGEYTQQAKGRAEKKAAATPLEAPPGAGAAATVAAAFSGPGGTNAAGETQQQYAKSHSGYVTNVPGLLIGAREGTPEGTAQKRVKGRADGGPLTPGHAYIVGERGPELVVPKTPGRVVPNNRLAAIRKAAGRRRG